MVGRKRIPRSLLTLKRLPVRRKECLVKWQSSIVLLQLRNRMCCCCCCFFFFSLYEIDRNCFSIFSYYLFIYACWSRWYEWWEKSGFFVADAKSSKPSFVIVSLFLDFFKIVYGVIRAFFFVSVFCFHVTKKILNRKI